MWSRLLRWWKGQPKVTSAPALDLRGEVARIFGSPASSNAVAPAPVPSPSSQRFTSRPVRAPDEEPAPPPPPPRGSTTILGIDFGTTHAVMAVMEGHRVTIIPNLEGEPLTPCFVTREDDGWLVGEPARRRRVTNPRRSIFSFKRLLGRRLTNAESLRLPYGTDLRDEGLTRVEIDGRFYMPAELAARLLRRMKEAAERFLGHPVHRVVLAVPASFDDAQRQTLVQAAQMAGFDSQWHIEDPGTGKVHYCAMRLLSEPVAAVLPSLFRRRNKGRILVFHLGGGTCDVAVMDCADGVVKVEAVAADDTLGGDDFDGALLGRIADEFRRAHAIDVLTDATAMQRLGEAVEQLKRRLSSIDSDVLELRWLAQRDGAPLHLARLVTRAELETLAAPLLERVRAVLARGLRDCRLGPTDIDEVLLTGGMTRAPCVQAVLAAMFPRSTRRTLEAEAVAAGAAIHAAQLLLGSKSELLVVDVAPLTLGVETLGGILTPLIPRNTSIPRTEKRTFSTAEDNQTVVTISIYQGEGDITKGGTNRLLGEFNLEGIPPAPRGVPQIEVTFDINADGQLHVTARDLGSGREVKVRPSARSGMTQMEVEWLRRELEGDSQRGQALDEARAEGRRLLEELREQFGQIGTATALGAALARLEASLAGLELQALRWQIARVREAAAAAVQFTTAPAVRFSVQTP